MRLMRVLALAIAVWSLGVAAPSEALAESAADVAAARELFIQGSEASREERWGDAKELFGRSLALKRAAITMYSLGIAQMNDGDVVEALENLRAFLAEPVKDSTRPYLEPAEEAIAALEPRVARLDIQVKPAGVKGVRIAVDREEVPPAAHGVPRLVNPGEHVVKAEAPGYASRTIAVTAVSGQTEPVVLLLSPENAAADEGTSGSGDFPVGPVVLMAAGGATFGAGLVVGLIGVSEAGDAPSADSPEADAAKTKALAGDIVAGVGAAAAIGGLLWLLLDDDDGEPTAAGLQPWLGGTSVGLSWVF